VAQVILNTIRERIRESLGEEERHLFSTFTSFIIHEIVDY